MVDITIGSRIQLDVDSSPVTRMDAFDAAMKRENFFYDLALGDGSLEVFDADPTYDFKLDEANRNYNPADLAWAKSAEEAASIRGQLDREREQLKLIDANGWGFAGHIAGVFTRPELWVTGGVMARSGAGIGKIAITEMGVEIGHEAALHTQQRMRTMNESLVNIAAAGAGTYLLGRGIQWMTRSKEVPFAQSADDLDVDSFGKFDAIDAGEYGGTVGAKMTDEEILTAARPVGGNWLGWLSMGPAGRLMTSESPTAVVLNQRLTNQSIYSRGMVEGLTEGPSIEAYAVRSQGEVLSQFDEMDELMKKSGLDEASFYNEVTASLRRGEVHDNIQVSKAARIARDKILEPRGKTLKDLKLIKGVEGYVPRLYNREAIRDNWDKVRNLISEQIQKDNPKLSIGELNDATGETVQNMMGGMPLTPDTVGVRVLKARTIKILDTILEPYLENNAKKLLMGYTRSVDPHILIREAFGQGGIAGEIKLINAEYRAKINAAKTPRKKKQLEKQNARDIRDIGVMEQRLFNRPRYLYSGATQTVQMLKTWNVATQLGGIVPSSLPDIARPMMMHGFNSFGRSLAHHIRMFRASPEFKKMTKVQVRRTGAALQRALNQRLLNITDVEEGVSKVNDVVLKGFGKFTGFNAYTDIMETVAVNTAMDQILRVARKADAGKKLNRLDTMKMARMGFTQSDLKMIYKESLRTGGAKDDVLLYANTMEWENFDLAKKFEAALGADAHKTIVRIGIGDKPAWLDEHPIWSLLFQYKTFMIASMNRMIIAGIQQRDLSTMMGALASIYIGSHVGGLKAWLRGEDSSKWSAEKQIMEGIDRSGMLGIYTIPYNLLRQQLGGAPSRYLHRGVISQFGGPTIGRVKDLVDIGTGDATYENVSRQIPFWSNALHIRQAAERLIKQ